MPDPIRLSKEVPVVAEVDVLIAGGGIAGCHAAVTAARNGADVMLVERFGRLGGNMGPGMFSGGVVHLALPCPDAMPEGLRGIPGEFLERCGAYVDGQLGYHYFKDSEVVSYVWLRMMQENNVRLMLNSTVSDVLMDGSRIIGLVFENRSGSQAARAKVVIDATGDAEVANRAGAQMDAGTTYSHSGMFLAMADVDEHAYNHFVESAPPTDPADLEWIRQQAAAFGLMWPGQLNPLLPVLRHAWSKGEYRFIQPVAELAAVTLDHGLYFSRQHPGIVGAQVGVRGNDLHCGDAAVMNELECGARRYIFETARFFRHHVPGFEGSYLHATSPYFHTRGGRSAVCDYVLTKDDVARGAAFPDVLFRTWGSEVREGEFTPEGFEFPYRQFLPRGVEGLLMAGRSAIVQPPVNRTRYKVMLMGQAAGVAAAVAARQGVTPRQVEPTDVRSVLHRKYHVPLGTPERRRELGLP